MDDVIDIGKNKVPKVDEPEHIFVRSGCCSAPWDLSRLDGVWIVSCIECGTRNSSFKIQGPDIDGCTCDACKKKLTEQGASMKTLKKVCVNETEVVFYRQILSSNDVYSDCLGNTYYYDDHGTFIPADQAKQYLEVYNQ